MHDALITIGLMWGAVIVSFSVAMWLERRYKRRYQSQRLDNEYYSMCEQARKDGFIQ